MTTYHIKQKLWSLGGEFEIKDGFGNPAYSVAGSFFKIPKYFTVNKQDGTQVSKITKVMFQFLPKFDVALSDGSGFRIAKAFTLFKPRYHIEDLGLDVQGNFWDMNFDLIKNDVVVAQISQEWFKLTSTYNIDIYDDRYADIVISLVIAIDYVKEQESHASSSSST